MVFTLKERLACVERCGQRRIADFLWFASEPNKEICSTLLLKEKKIYNLSRQKLVSQINSRYNDVTQCGSLQKNDIKPLYLSSHSNHFQNVSSETSLFSFWA